MLFILQVFIPRCKFTIFFHTCKSFLIKIEKNGQVLNRIRRRMELENGNSILLPAIMTQFLRTQFLSFVLGGILDGYKL